MKRVLIAVDDSIRAAGVFDAGSELARVLEAEIYLLRVLQLPPEFPPAAAGSKADPLPEYLTEATTQALRVLAQRAPQVTVARIMVSFGEPTPRILETADSLDVDLIVVGSHGYRGWDRLLGTTAASVANLSTRNVLIIHERPPGAVVQAPRS